MLAYIIRRLGFSFITLLIVFSVIFFVLRVAPGDPTLLILGDFASQQARATLRHKLGLDQPLYIQYVQYFKRLVTFDFGRSMIAGVRISTIIAQSFPYTLLLALASILITTIVGTIVGFISVGLRYRRVIDYILRVFISIPASLPSFYIAVLLILFFSISIPIFPSTGGGSFESWSSLLYHLILPAFSVGIAISGLVARIARTAMLERIEADYISTARAKGLSESKVMWQLLRNSLIPLVTVLGIYMGNFLGGIIIVESIFARPGLGRALINAVSGRDYPTVEVLLTVIALLVVSLNIFVDLLYAYIDPRIRYD